MLPVWQALGEEHRGELTTGRAGPSSEAMMEWGYRQGVHVWYDAPRYAPDVYFVASSGDMVRAQSFHPDVPIVFAEHGCGLSYGPRGGPSYVGSTSRVGVSHILVPNELAAAPQRVATPDIPVTVLGSSPRLDRWVGVEKPGSGTTVAISFHWDCDVVPETRTALFHYRRVLRSAHQQLADLGVRLVGHFHPRIERMATVAYQLAGMDIVDDFDWVMANCAAYAVDNSSTLYEFAATDRPVVALNCPRYRRFVHHGLRFWDFVPGLQCDEPGDLVSTILRALEDPPEARELRRTATEVVYPRNDGAASSRAVEAILSNVSTAAIP